MKLCVANWVKFIARCSGWLALLATVNALSATPYEGLSPLPAQNKIDELVFARLAKLHLTPAKVCSDPVFVRRVYLDLTGTLPTASEAQQFILDRNPDKRSELIDRLLARDEFADYFAMKWGDLLRIKAEFPINLWPNAAQSYHRWVHDAIRDSMPGDQFARALLTASGSNFENPPLLFSQTKATLIYDTHDYYHNFLA